MKSGWRRVWLALLLLAIAWRLIVCGDSCDDGATTVRLGTFNIENYPASQRQIEGAFEAIASLDALAVGVQEITDPRHFRDAARAHLSPAWEFVHTNIDNRQQIGVVYDGAALELLGTWSHPETVVHAGAKPAFEVRLRRRGAEHGFRLIVVHLKAGGDSADVRERQLAGLERVLLAHDRGDEPVVLLGDFNATGGQDRAAIARLTRATRTHWASEALECTSYWNRRDGCVGSPLDHIITSGPVVRIAARGPCESEGCQRRDRCPVFHREVSDHCPVMLEMAVP